MVGPCERGFRRACLPRRQRICALTPKSTYAAASRGCTFLSSSRGRRTRGPHGLRLVGFFLSGGGVERVACFIDGFNLYHAIAR